MRRIFKYPTGAIIPNGAIFLSTVIQTEIFDKGKWNKCWLVWHYFSVEVKE